MAKLAILVLLLLLTSLVADHAAAQPPTEPTYVYNYCDIFDFDNNEHKTNLKTALKELQDQAKSTSFYNTSSGSGSNKVYGQFYCRGDIQPQLCSQCISIAGSDIFDFCYEAQTVTALYEECTVRFDNQTLFGVEAHFPNFANSSRETVLDSGKFGTVLKSTIDKLIDKAAYGNGSLHFAAGEGVVSSSETVYCLVQCSPDLSTTQCETCLRSTYDSIPGFKGEWAHWAVVFYPSCQLRYRNQGAFYTRSNSPPESSLSPELPPAPDLPPVVPAKGKKASYYVVRAIIPAVVVALLVLLCVSVCFINRRKRILTTTSSQTQPVKISTAEAGAAETEVETTDCIQFDLKTIEGATNSFSLSNKLGQGGFGIVYQGTLEDGQGIAVKRLSKNSGQGTKEFKTEVAVVAKLQHINLVRLVGCCAVGEERLLVYEFLSNLSLDRFLFDETRSAYLTWEIRHRIIKGIARGLQYLHQDSRVKIVHRDLKTSNILLDENLDPKIADFGLAKLVKVDQTAGNTTKVIGTYGYMAPEYALAGRYSTKSDVYSFGVIVLEVLSGKTNSLFYEISHGEGLLRHAWRAWKEGGAEQLMDPILRDNYSKNEAERCLHIGLLCVQDDAASRPTMQAVLFMLSSTSADLPSPSSPSHSDYISRISSDEGTQEGASKQQEIESSFSSAR